MVPVPVVGFGLHCPPSQLLPSWMGKGRGRTCSLAGLHTFFTGFQNCRLPSFPTALVRILRRTGRLGVAEHVHLDLTSLFQTWIIKQLT